MALDPNGMTFSGIIGREATIVKDGKYIKDFSYLGRPIKDVIYLDFTDETVPYHKTNAIILPEWSGDLDDRALHDILPFLSAIAQKPVDCRDEIMKYGSESTAKNFNRVAAYQHQMIMQKREQGLSGLALNLNRMGSNMSDQQRDKIAEEQLNKEMS